MAFRPAHAPAPNAPKLAEVRKALDAAVKLFQRANYVAAIEAFEKIIARYPMQTDIHALGERYLSICRHRLQAPVAVPQTPESLYDLGVVELNNGNFEAAIAMFQRALKSRPDAAHVLYSLAAAQVRSGESDEGLRTLERAVAAWEPHRYKARTDPDFVLLRGDTRFQDLVGLGGN